MMPAGEFDKRATFRKRAVQAPVAGNMRGEFADYCQRRVRFRPGAGSRAVEAGQLTDVGIARLWVRPDAVTRTIAVGFRVTVDGVDYAVLHVPPPQRGAHAIEMLIESTRV